MATQNTMKSGYQILICLIETWPFDMNDKSADPLKEPSNPNMFAEVEEVTIEDTYKKLICSASVKFPRGTILHQTLTPVNGKVYDIDAKVTGEGLLVEHESNGGSRLAALNDFKIGHRIRISLGYTDKPEVAAMTGYNNGGKNIFNDAGVLAEYRKSLMVMFDGYITKVSLDTPIELECENLASKLKHISCPVRAGKKGDTINVFFSEADEETMKKNKELNLLKGTGLKLYPQTRSNKIDLGPIDLVDDYVVADVFEIWADRKVYSFVKTEVDPVTGVLTPYVAIGRPYFSSPSPKNASLQQLCEVNASVPEIDFSWHVAKNGLTLMNTDVNLVAVDAQCWELATKDKGKDKAYKITVIRNPKYDKNDPNSKPFRTVNECTISKLDQKLGRKLMTDSKDKVNLDLYQVIPYMSRTINCPHDQLIQEAIEYLETYNPNGIEGSLALFGDLKLKAGCKVHLRDDYHSHKNGMYFVDEVKTEFGVNGFRQTIKLPYCISRDDEQPKQ